MFERFTKEARAAVQTAYQEAGDTMGPGHLLLGVAATPGRAAEVLARHGADPDSLRPVIRPGSDADALASLGIDLHEVRRRAEAAFGEGALERRRRRRGHVRTTAAAKQALELSLREALGLGDNFIGTEHVLLGLLREGAAARPLQRLDVDVEALRAELTPAGSRRGRGA